MTNSSSPSSDEADASPPSSDTLEENPISMAMNSGSSVEEPSSVVVVEPPHTSDTKNADDDSNSNIATASTEEVTEQQDTAEIVDETTSTNDKKETTEAVVAGEVAAMAVNDTEEKKDDGMSAENVETTAASDVEIVEGDVVVVVVVTSNIEEESAEIPSTNDSPEEEENDDDDDEEQKWLKQESFVEPDEDDIIEDDKVRAEQEEREAALEETRRKQEEVSKKMAEVEAKLKKEQEAKALIEAKARLKEQNEKVVAEAATAAAAKKKEEEEKVASLKAEQEAATMVEEKEIPPTKSIVESPSDEVGIRNEQKEEVSVQVQQEDIIEVEDENKESEKNVQTTTSTEPTPAPQLQVDVTNDMESAPSELTPSSGVSFAQAFSGKKLPPSTPSAAVPQTPSNLTVASSSPQGESETPIPDTPNSVASHSALSASKNKKASGLISKYKEEVAHKPLPGDSVPIRSIKGNSFSSSSSPGSARIMKKKVAATCVELEKLPDMNSVRAKFEKSARSSSSNFEFGESFRQKKRHEQLSEKERKEEAKVAIRGFNEKIMNGGRTASGEIDTSNLPKSFTFEMSSHASIIPNDGVCRVDYKEADFYAKVFVVHKTRGMLLLQDKKTTTKNSQNTVPGGVVMEEEFLSAAKESGSAQVQLQIAARDAAARQLYETTGLDIRQQAERFKPAVLSVTPSMNAARGFQYLRNENDNKLYYFLQVDEDDFEKLKDAQGDAAKEKLTRPSSDSGDDPLKLKLSCDYSGFEFVHDPVDASIVLKKDGNDAATALHMIMNAATQEINENGPASKSNTKKGPDAKSNTEKGPDAKATEYSSKSRDMPDDEQNGTLLHGNVRTIGSTKETKDTKNKKKKTGKSNRGNGKDNSFYEEEAKLIKSPSADPADDIVATCCCSFWY